MIVELMDYMDRKSPHDLGDESEIVAAYIKVLSGDEICEVLYKDGSCRYFDSCDEGRFHDFNDGRYLAFMPSAGIDLFNSQAWLARKNSYTGQGVLT